MTRSILRRLLHDLITLICKTTQLILAIRLLLIAATAAAATVTALTLHQKQPSPPPLPLQQCTLASLNPALVQEVDRRFYQNHPEIPISQRISRHQGKLAEDWWSVCDDVLSDRPTQNVAKPAPKGDRKVVERAFKRSP